MITSSARILWRALKWILYSVVSVCAFVIFALFALWVVARLHETKDRITAAPSSGHYVRAADVDMYVQEWGAQGEPAVVFIHAAGGWSGVWKLTGEDLSKEGFHVIALDMPPLGFSQIPDSPRYSREDQAKRIIGVLDALKISKATIVGHSIGGRAAAEAALMFPERVNALVLVDAALSFNTGTATSWVDRVNIFLVRDAFSAITFSNPLFTRELLTLFVADPKSASDYWVGIYQQPMGLKGSTDAIGDWLSQLFAEHDFSDSSDPTAYHRLKMPTLVMWGARDTITPLSLGQYIATIIPGARLVILPGLGHLPPVENNDLFNKTLLEFLRTVH